MNDMTYEEAESLLDDCVTVMMMTADENVTAADIAEMLRGAAVALEEIANV